MGMLFGIWGLRFELGGILLSEIEIAALNVGGVLRFVSLLYRVPQQTRQQTGRTPKKRADRQHPLWLCALP